jgi:hypothetical protein
VGQALWHKVAVVLDQLLQGPEGQLRVIARVSLGDASPVADQVVADIVVNLPSAQWELGLRSVSKGVADGHPQKHPLHAVEVEILAFGGKRGIEDFAALQPDGFGFEQSAEYGGIGFKLFVHAGAPGLAVAGLLKGRGVDGKAALGVAGDNMAWAEWRDISWPGQIGLCVHGDGVEDFFIGDIMLCDFAHRDPHWLRRKFEELRRVLCEVYVSERQS